MKQIATFLNQMVAICFILRYTGITILARGGDVLVSKKDWPARTFRLSPELLERLDAYCVRTGVSKQFVAEKAIAMYLEDVDESRGTD